MRIIDCTTVSAAITPNSPLVVDNIILDLCSLSRLRGISSSVSMYPLTTTNTYAYHITRSYSLIEFRSPRLIRINYVIVSEQEQESRVLNPFLNRLEF
jgi:hypothetical protein